jgi:tRNA 2-selenouridine synthase
MSIRTIGASEALSQLATFDTIIDARSEDEYALDHLPGAVNWPTLRNGERVEVGTLHRHDPLQARKQGAVYAARNIAAHVEREVLDKPRSWRPLVYCWRGGQRSGALATILGAIGFAVTRLDGGYKAWRAALVADIPYRVAALSFRVVCGPTGSGKTRLLHALAAEGAQVLDLEALACHRSSVLGLMPGQAQPSQKRFDSLIWERLRAFDPARPVYVESESKKVGNLRIPDALVEAMHASPCIDVHLPEPERVALLLEDYDFFVRDRALFVERLRALTALAGRSTVEAWVAQVNAGHLDEVVLALLTQYYDPRYAASIRRHFARYDDATPLILADRSAASLRDAARELLARDAAG